MIRWRFVLCSTVAAVAAVGFLLLLIPPPAFVWHAVFRSEARSLFNERSLTGAWVNKAIASELSANIPSAQMPEAHRIGLTLVALKPLLISQTEVPHGPALSEVGISGLGWCNHINGFAAEVLSHRYKAQVVAVTMHEAKASHSFGRVWSSEWLYFDVWADEIVVFRATAEGAQFLFRYQTKPTMKPADLAKIRLAYDDAENSFVILDLQPTVGGMIANHIGNIIDHGNRLPKGAAQAIAADNAITGGSVYDPPPQMGTAAARQFAEARIEQLSGQPSRDKFQMVTSSGSYGVAAKVFALRDPLHPKTALAGNDVD